MSRLPDLDDALDTDGALPTEAELEALAIGDLDTALSADATPLVLARSDGALPGWYMPAIAQARLWGWRRPLVVGLVAVLLTLEVLGLCSAFGQVVIG